MKMKMILTLFPRVDMRARLEQLKVQFLRFTLLKRRVMDMDNRDLDRPLYRSNPFVFKRRPNPP
jgi:hypothetical protein